MCLVLYVVCCCLHEVGSRAQATLHQSCQYAWGKGGVHVQGGSNILQLLQWVTYVVLTWSPPMDLGIGGPLYYNVSYQAVSGPSNVTSVITNDTHVNVTNLYPGITYMMTVEADNGGSGDESKRSASINVTTNSTGTCMLHNHVGH